jgi:FG-GAP-like repeat
MQPKLLIPCLLLAAVLTLAAQSETKKAKPPELAWEVKQLVRDNNEGAAVGDINGDGKTDISSGEFWYAAPDFAPQPLRKILPFGADYMQNCSEFLYDMDGDSDLDVLTKGFTETMVRWFENPGAGKYVAEGWAAHDLIDTGNGQNEAAFLLDLDGDGLPEWIENSWVAKNPMTICRLTRGKDGKIVAERHVVAESGNGHGMGFGDLSGDGRTDIVFLNGWYECPVEGPFSGLWAYHPDFDLPHASCPILVLDLDGDGDQDLIWGDGHNYGLYWHERLEPQSDGSTTWRQHLIDKKFSQAHCLAWVDIDQDGAPELITGMRYYAHSGNDPGEQDEVTLQYYDWEASSRTWTKHFISRGPSGQGPGTGLQINATDLDGDGWVDLVMPGKSGTHILWNRGWTKPA